MAYDNKFKKRAVEYHKEGNSVRKTAKTFDISPNTLNTWLKEYREHGEFTIKPKPANNTKLTEAGYLRIMMKMTIVIKRKPQNTLALVRQRIF